jgi:hypothetical protein
LAIQLKQKVFLEVWDAQEGGNLILDASGLRVDFDVRHIPDFSRASFTIYNLNNETITSLMSEGLYVTLKVQLHDGNIQLIADKFYINNAVDELVLPNRITTLYCFDRLRSMFLEKQVSIPVSNFPSFKDMVDSLLKKAGHGATRDDEYENFPAGRVYQPCKRPTRLLNGSVQQCLRRLEREFRFYTYTKNGRFIFKHFPDLGTVGKTSLADAPVIQLSTRSMRSNPKIGMASCSIHSNLNGEITPSSVLDLSRLLTIAVDGTSENLQLTENYLKNFSNNTIYQAFAITHTGSNYTADWSTRITGLSPTQGKKMPTGARWMT